MRAILMVAAASMVSAAAMPCRGAPGDLRPAPKLLELFNGPKSRDLTRTQEWRVAQSAHICWVEGSKAWNEREVAAAEQRHEAQRANEARGRLEAGKQVEEKARAALKKRRAKPLPCTDAEERTAERCLFYTATPSEHPECAPYAPFQEQPSRVGPPAPVRPPPTQHTDLPADFAPPDCNAPAAGHGAAK